MAFFFASPRNSFKIGKMKNSPDSSDSRRFPGGFRGFLRAFAAVFSAMFGVRRGGAADRDWSALRPMHIVVAAVVAVTGFVLLLLAIVHAIVP